MKRTGIILLVFLLILPFAFSTSVFDGRLYDDEPKEKKNPLDFKTMFVNGNLMLKIRMIGETYLL